MTILSRQFVRRAFKWRVMIFLSLLLDKEVSLFIIFQSNLKIQVFYAWKRLTKEVIYFILVLLSWYKFFYFHTGLMPFEIRTLTAHCTAQFATFGFIACHRNFVFAVSLLLWLTPVHDLQMKWCPGRLWFRPFEWLDRLWTEVSLIF